MRLDVTTEEFASEPIPTRSPTGALAGRSNRLRRRSLLGEPVNASETSFRQQAYPTADALWGAPAKMLSDLVAYQRDAWERSILFLDALRQRADNMLAHERAGKPPLLDFDHELVLDARSFDRPANYTLLRIRRYADKCLEDCLDLSKSPVIIVDPRAGHGPGIGGFKRESEAGVALHEGHPVYFIAFFPEPCPGQMLGDVLHALRRFVEEVSALHGGKAPILYGNCQGRPTRRKPGSKSPGWLGKYRVALKRAPARNGLRDNWECRAGWLSAKTRVGIEIFYSNGFAVEASASRRGRESVNWRPDEEITRAERLEA